MNINNHTMRLKREVMIRLIKLFDQNALDQSLHTIPRLMTKEQQNARSCCLFHDRAIIEQQLQNFIGLKLEQVDPMDELRDLWKKHLQNSDSKDFHLNILSNACHSCPQESHVITNACRGCLARPCQANCPKDAISFENQRAKIDQSKCINCGKCVNECAYHAITYIPVPCKAACPVKAIDKDTNGQMQIDKSKCIACGKCIAECPFGAIMPRSSLIKVLEWMKDGQQVIAGIAPAIYGQFNSDKEQLAQALKQLGFSQVVAVAKGAELTIEHEANELAEKIEQKAGPLTSSCCPAYVQYATKHAPELVKLISHTPSPMHYSACATKQQWQNAKFVFIGPCVGKMAEAENDQYVDAVLTFEELGALFVAREIEILNQPTSKTEMLKASADAENFANSGGVGTAVLNRLKNTHPNLEVRTRTIDGLDKKNMALLKSFTKDLGQWDFTEVMSCSGGCVGGSCTITNAKTAAVRIKKISERK